MGTAAAIRDRYMGRAALLEAVRTNVRRLAHERATASHELRTDTPPCAD
jgi:hypothetical protein